ncbi:MAG: InlB B-repeat-containing protein [Bacteroidia bacterium]
MKTYILLAIFCFAQITSAWAKTIYVNQNATGTNNGSSWANAYMFIDDALTNWQMNDSIWVAKGQYSPKDSLTTSTYLLPSGCVIIGGFNGTEQYTSQHDPVNNLTILSGDINDKNYPNDNIRTIVTANKTAQGTKINGFVIKDGYNYTVAGGITKGGGAIRIIDAYLEIENCQFYDNYAYMRGGAIYQQTSSKQVRITNCKFENNSTGIDVNSLGGAIFANSAYFFIQDTEFNLNTSQSGGAISLYEAKLHIDRTIFSGNEARIRNGGAIHDGGDTEFRVYNSLFVGNVADDNCPAIYSSAVFNTRYNEVINCTFAQNIAKPISGTYTVRANENTKVYNSIFYDNQATMDLFNLSPTFVPDVKNCLFEDGITIGSNNIKDIPYFKKPASKSDAPFHHKNYNYRLRIYSPCFEYGDNNLVNSNYKYDIDGNERPQYYDTDMGAYEADFDLVWLDVAANPEDADTFWEWGYYTRDTNLTLYADTTSCFKFVNWTSNGIEISTEPILKLHLVSDSSLFANYTTDSFTIKVASADETMGTASGAGTFNCANTSTATVEAKGTKCYKFLNWTENGEEVSKNASYTFQLDQDRDLVANFQKKVFEVSTTIYPSGTGSVQGKKSAICSTEVSIKADPSAGWQFLKWTENGQTISTERRLEYTATKSRFLTAHFEENVGFEEFVKAGFNLYPNPVHNQLIINNQNADLKVSGLVITDLNGREMIKQIISNEHTEQIIDVSTLANGSYFIIIKSDQKLYRTKFVVLKN